MFLAFASYTHEPWPGRISKRQRCFPHDRTFHGYGTILLKVILLSLWFQRSTVPLYSSRFLKEKNNKNVFCLLISVSFGPLVDSVLIQTLAEMTPGMILDLEVQEVLKDGSVVFSEGPVPGLVLRASKYHRAGECFSFAHHG